MKCILVECELEESNGVFFVVIKRGMSNYLGMMLDLFHGGEVQGVR